MKALLLALLLWQAAGPTPEPRHMRYQREIDLPAAVAGQACVTLDAAVYAHGAASLKDVRLYEGAREVPYAITMSEAAEAESESARVLNAGTRSGKLVFDLAMPARPYTDVVLDLAGENFIAAAEVTGSNGGGDAPTTLGTFTLFDLSGQHLTRSTTLHLAESQFPMLHVAMTISPAPGAVAAANVAVGGASVPPSREAQTLYTAVAEALSIAQRGHETVATFRLPAFVPVERVTFALAPGYAGSFSRGVTVTARAAGDTPVEKLAGQIERVRLTRAGRDIRQEQLSLPATLGANLQGDATVEVAVQNGDDAPLPLAGVRLEMRERRLCFPLPSPASPLTLFYGDPALTAPAYDFARVFSPGPGIAAARLGPETLNPRYAARAETFRSLTERHPELLWVALLAVVCVLAVVATHSAKRV